MKPFVPTKLPDQYAQEPTSPFHTEHVKWKDSDEPGSSLSTDEKPKGKWVPKGRDSHRDNESEPSSRRRVRGKRKQRKRRGGAQYWQEGQSPAALHSQSNSSGSNTNNSAKSTSGSDVSPVLPSNAGKAKKGPQPAHHDSRPSTAVKSSR